MGGSYVGSDFPCSRRAESPVARVSGRCTGGLLIRCALGGVDRMRPSARPGREAQAAHRIVCRRRRCSSRRALLRSRVTGTVIRPPHAMGVFEFAVVAALRAAQLARGCRPRVAATRYPKHDRFGRTRLEARLDIRRTGERTGDAYRPQSTWEDPIGNELAIEAEPGDGSALQFMR